MPRDGQRQRSDVESRWHTAPTMPKRLHRPRPHRSHNTAVEQRAGPAGCRPVTPPLPPAVSGERFEFDSLAGRISAYVAGQGPPLLLVHSVNAAACAAEVRPLYEHYRETRTVFAIDLPGYGFSERSDRAYTPRLMTDALHAMAAQIRQRCGSVPIDALALSLACEFLARAAVEVPATWRSLALVSPTGFSGKRKRRAPAGSTLGMPWLHRLLRGPGWGAHCSEG